MRCSTLLLALVFVMLTTPASGRTWQVPDDVATIQAGIDAAAAGDTVLVSCGTYNEHDIEMKSGVCLVGETGSPGGVLIDAQALGDFAAFGAHELPAIRIDLGDDADAGLTELLTAFAEALA